MTSVLEERPCLIVGASGNIGETIAAKLSQSGRKLALIHSPRSAPTVDIPSATWYQVDVTDSSQVAELVAKVKHDFGSSPDLVYCAGIVRDSAISFTSDEIWHSVIDANLNGAFYFIREISKSIVTEDDGRIVLISSVSATKGNPGQLSYSATKGALESMCRVIAVELGRYGVTCNVVSPGVIESRMVKDTPPKSVEGLLKKTPLRKVGKPEDVASLVDYLLTADARYITGQIIQVDGGMTAA
ncbi:SDR family NAD(P)-dependent oxidoreductase [Pectobacterium brasiliense]|uniref:SDR family NAD(P)-dependent oxidoreductase n=1 Tax=Pectobacterium brasiliense TaxID=180957 RepID=UPI00068F298E|nr:SDR family oxidoreductase [Pectobacterium brasiliense]